VRRQVMLDRPIKTLGLHDVRIGLHAEVEPHVTINVARSQTSRTPGTREQVTGKAMDDAEEEAIKARGCAEKLLKRARARACRGDRRGGSRADGVPPRHFGSRSLRNRAARHVVLSPSGS